jgi:hypothetical protein
VESDSESADTAGPDSSDSDGSELNPGEEVRGPGSTIYHVIELTPLSIFPAWDEVNASLNIRLEGPNSLKGLCDEAHFARMHLTMTSSAFVNGSTQAKAALFCLKQIQSKDITKDLHIAFSKLLSHSLLHSTRQLPELINAIQMLRTQHLALYQILPSETQIAITDYLEPVYQNPTITSPSHTQFTTSQVLLHSTQAQPSPSTSQKASNASQAPHKTQSTPQPPSSTGLKKSSATPFQPSHPQPAPPCTLQPSARTQPSSLGSAEKPLSRSRTPEQPGSCSCKAAQLAITWDPEFLTAQHGPSFTSQSTLGPSHCTTSAQGPSDSSKHPSSSRHRKSGKGVILSITRSIFVHFITTLRQVTSFISTVILSSLYSVKAVVFTFDSPVHSSFSTTRV